MRLVFIAFSFLTCFLSLTSKAQNSSKWDLRRCVEYAMANNISVRQADVQARLSAITLKQSKLQQIPSLNFQGSNGFQFGNTVDPTTNIRTDRSSMYQQFNLSAQANLFNWNSQKNTISANDLYNQADKAALEKAKNDIALTVANQYLITVLQMETVEINAVALAQTAAHNQPDDASGKAQ